MSAFHSHYDTDRNRVLESEYREHISKSKLYLDTSVVSVLILV